MTPDRAREVLDLWLSMTPEQLDDVCLSEPARLAVKRLRDAMAVVGELRERSIAAPDATSSTIYSIIAFGMEAALSGKDGK